MTVTSEAAYAERAWSGGQTSFVPGFAAANINHIVVRYRSAAGVVSTLAIGSHVQVIRDGNTGAITVLPLAMPAAPGTVMIERRTPATQEADFTDLQAYSAELHEQLADAAALRTAEDRARFPAATTPNLTGIGIIDVPGYTLRAEAPTNDRDLVNLGYFNANSGQAQITGVIATVNGLIANASVTFTALQTQIAADIASANATFTATINGLTATFNGQIATASQAATDAAAARDLALNYRNGAQTYQLLAKDYATKAEDSQVETGTYSAFHWSRKSYGYAQNAAASAALLASPDLGFITADPVTMTWDLGSGLP